MGVDNRSLYKKDAHAFVNFIIRGAEALLHQITVRISAAKASADAFGSSDP